VYWQHGSQFDYPRGPAFVEPAYRWSGDKTWRHVAWQWDEVNPPPSLLLLLPVSLLYTHSLPP